MKRAAVFVALIAAMAIAVAPAQAARPQAVTITDYVTVGPEPDFAASGRFTTTGPLCASGTDVNLSRVLLPSLTGTQNILVTKRFTCDDGSGTFDVALLVHLSFATDPFTDTFYWTVVGGTGAYQHLRGAGTGTGVPQDDGRLLDTYRGLVIG
jgi:hypothetical protein